MLRTSKKIFNKCCALERRQSDGPVGLSVSSHPTTDKDQAAATQAFSKLHQIGTPPTSGTGKFVTPLLCFSPGKSSPNSARKKGSREPSTSSFNRVPNVCNMQVDFLLSLYFFVMLVSSLLLSPTRESCNLLFNNSELARQNNYFTKLLWSGGKRQLKQHVEQPNMSTRSWRVNRNVLCLSFSKLESRVSIGKRSWILCVCCGFLLMSCYFDFSHSPVLLVRFAFPDRKEISNSSNPGPSQLTCKDVFCFSVPKNIYSYLSTQCLSALKNAILSRAFYYS